MDIYDNGGDSVDRYTIFITGTGIIIGASEEGYTFYQHLYGVERGRHLGKKVPFTSLSTALRIKLAQE